MEFIDLTVADCHYRIEFERRITVITGDSGVGKTEFVSNLNVSAPNVIMKASRNVIRADENWEILMRGSMSSIIVFDDMEVVGSSRFSKVVSDTNESGNFIVIIGRENFSSKTIAQISVSTSSMCRFVTDASGKLHYIVPQYPTSGMFGKFDFDIVIVEDSSSGKEWFSKFFPDKDVKPAYGKANIVKRVTKMIKQLKLEKRGCTGILVVFDNAAYGGYIEKFAFLVNNSLKDSDIPVYFLDDYESFEELLLESNLLKTEYSSFKLLVELNKNYSWEKSFEEILHKLTTGTPYEISDKSDLPDCYFENCCSKVKCDKFMTGNKFECMLSDTKYAYLLCLR